MTSDRSIVADKPRKVPGKVFVKEEWCKGCGFCIEFCPTKVLSFSSGFNAKGYHIPDIVKPDLCTGCDLCGMVCPEFSIWGTKE